jgi:hypothetical protein
MHAFLLPNTAAFTHAGGGLKYRSPLMANPKHADAIRSSAHPEEQADNGLLLAELARKVYLTTAEAVRYSGLTVDVLAELVEKKKVRRWETMRPFRYRRADLEKL